MRNPAALLARYPMLLVATGLTVVMFAGCDTNTGFRIDPVLTTDTIDLGVPAAAAGLPTALDITATANQIAGGRHPERQEDAEQFDFAVRRRDGALALVPATALGLESRAAITRPLAGKTFESLIEAPGRNAFVADSAVALVQGAVYAARSRYVSTGYSTCQQYAKLQPLAVDVTAGTVRILITTNQRCSDPRLAMED